MGAPEQKGETLKEPYFQRQTRHPIKAARLLFSAPNFILRGPIYLTFIVMFGMLVYSFIAKKDIIVTAPLKLEKKYETVESIGAGQVIEVRVKENASVKANDLLVRVQEADSGRRDLIE